MTDSLLPRSESVGAETLRALRAANTRLARELPPAPGALLRCPVEVGPAAIDPQTYGAFVAALHVPSCFNVVRGGACWKWTIAFCSISNWRSCSQ